MSLLGTFTKQPVERLDYDIGYADWLTPGDGVASLELVIDKPGLVSPAQNVKSSVVKIWLAGGTHATDYKITATVTTDDGRVKQDEFKLKVRES